MKRPDFLTSRVLLGLLLVLLSVFFYALHYALFRDAHHIFIYLVGDVAFVFLEVLLVTLILHQLLAEREKRAMLKKLNMVIGAFFSEVGTSLLEYFRDFDQNMDALSKRLVVNSQWSPEHFDAVHSALAKHNYKIDSRAGDLAGLQQFVVEKRSFLLGLLENPNLLEHEAFTELLWAVFHLAEELSHRPSVAKLPENDYLHLSGDIKRAYALLVREWLSHMKHLKADYPYLFSLAIRTNPFDPRASVEMP
jgi:hypothetical protein